MYSLLLLSGSAAFLAYLVTPVVVRVFSHLGLHDTPDKVRKLHDRSVPRVGGIPIVISYLGAFAVLAFANLSAMSIVQKRHDLLWGLLPATGIIFVVGLLDDLFQLKPWHKLGAQIIASYLAVLAGIKINLLLGFPLDGNLSVLATMLWLVGCSNAFNLIDGIDGLAAGIGLFAAGTMLVGALLQDNVELALATAPLAGALIGFLRYNFNPASVFLGDGGSLLIGFLLGCFAIVWEQKSTTALGLTAPLMVLALPLLDTGMAVVRRFVRHQPIFGADRGHIHHKLLDHGFSHRKVVIVLYLVTALGALFSLVQSTLDRTYAGVIIILFCGVMAYGMYRLGFIELVALGKVVTGSTLREVLKSQVLLHEAEAMIVAAETPEKVVEVVSDCCRRLGFDSVQYYRRGQSPNDQLHLSSFQSALSIMEERLSSPSVSATESRKAWILTVPVSDHGFLILSKSAPVAELSVAAVAFAELLTQTLMKREERTVLSAK